MACSGIFQLTPDGLTLADPAALSIEGTNCPAKAKVYRCDATGNHCEDLESSNVGTTWKVSLEEVGGVYFVGTKSAAGEGGSGGAAGAAGAGGTGGTGGQAGGTGGTGGAAGGTGGAGGTI